MTDTPSADRRESDFWGHHIPSLTECLEVYQAGPDPNTRAMLDALEPLAGSSVLDFACGVGVTTAWLAARGAKVTGVDITADAIILARQLCDSLGLQAKFQCCDVLAGCGRSLPVFERVAGKFALHHVDIDKYAPVLALHLSPDGIGAFVETMRTNPFLHAARRYLSGRFGIVKLGTIDEKPLGRSELRRIAAAFGALELRLGQMICLRILDRQLFHFRMPLVTNLCSAIDNQLYRWPHFHWMSYQRVLVVRKRGGQTAQNTAASYIG